MTADNAGSASAEQGPGRRSRRRWRHAALLVGLVVAAWACLSTGHGGTLVPAVWAPAGVLAGMLLTTRARRRAVLVVTAAALLVAAHLLHGYSAGLALGFSLASVVGSVTVPAALVAGRRDRRVALMDQGDVSRMIGAIALGSAVAGAGYGLTTLVVGTGSPFLAALSATGAHAAALMVLVPLFLEKLSFRPLASVRERATQTVITVGTTIVVFTPTGAPQLIFAVMPMFTWHAFRGSLRESTLVLTVVAVVATVLTAVGLGPVDAAGDLLGLPSELTMGVLQLFLVDCGLILLPLSVMVTQQRLSAARAEGERETLESVVHAATGTAVIATEVDGTIRLFNPGAEMIFGRRSDDVVGRSPDVLFSPTELEHQGASVHAPADFAAICAASVAAHAGSRLWVLTRPGSDEERTIRMTLTAIPNSLGEFSGYLATAHDVTEREAAHRALLTTLQHERDAADQLRDLERTKGDLVATVSHELRTPITSIMGYTEVLGDGVYGDLTPEQLDVLARVDKSSRRLLLLVEDLLTLSQVESATLELEKVEVDLRTLVTNAHESVAINLAGRSLDVRLHLPDAPVTHAADPAQLERMVLNLLTNAVKFTPDGGAVDVTLRHDAEQVEVIVQDTGIGIPQHEQPQLFTRFFRSSTAFRDAIPGTGLGLSIARAIVALHGGTIDVTSTEGRGSTFTVTLPRDLGVTTPVLATPPRQGARHPAVTSPLTVTG